MASLKCTITAALRQTGSTTTRCVMGGEGGGGRGGRRGELVIHRAVRVYMERRGRRRGRRGSRTRYARRMLHSLYSCYGKVLYTLLYYYILYTFDTVGMARYYIHLIQWFNLSDQLLMKWFLMVSS